MKITILGTGAWGVALSLILVRNGHEITLWSALKRQLDEIRATGRIESALPGAVIPREFRVEDNLSRAIEGAELILAAVASQYFRATVSQIGDFRGPIISVTKGIEFQSGLTMSGILEELLPQCLPVALSGPSLATEVARGVPTAVVAASHSQKSAQLAQDIFHSPTFRVYTSSDILGVELGGALKNIIAIGAGICDGMGFGSNSKAALLTRAIVEIRRLGVAMGAEADTFSGLSGLGDLMVTCFSTLSRNHSVGERLGKGEKLNEILASMSAVAEGVPTSASAHALSERFQVETPIMNEIYAILHEGKEMKESLHALIDRSQKAE
jgi:glycerol-3-phosphate dehydrogenase (NAD(P)+)